ncbi:MAG: zinc ribbon domain-containing protein [Planctomycetota bacterium]|jgi:predicted nucleic-acid-binding Zn-ribbon protein
MGSGRFECPKCGNHKYERGEMRAAGGFWSKIFDVQSRRFTSVTCTRCRYTEFYKGDSSALGNVLDFFTN